jgi:hypothetical protein
VVHGNALALEQDVQPPIAPARPRRCEIAELGDHFGRGFTPRAVLGARSAETEHPARSPLAQINQFKKGFSARKEGKGHTAK